MRWAWLCGLFLGAVACTSNEGAATRSPTAAPSVSPAGQVKLLIAYGSEKKTWFEEQAKRFAATSPKTASGKSILIETRAMGSGEAMQAIVSGDLKAHVFSPASTVYLTLLNQAWTTKTQSTRPLVSGGEPIVLSPVVIALWKPMAEALGWPTKPIGWSTLLKVSTNKGGWAGYGHPEWGGFKLGHTHPEYSSSGILSVLAEAYAGAKKTRQLSGADLEKKATQAFLREVEKSIVHYGKSTGFFADKMLARGPTYLSAAVLYENLVVESYSKTATAPFPIVAVYPQEGTFWADHPYAVIDAPWVGKEEKDAAATFLAFLKDKPQQTRALALGFRPADPSIAIAAPIDAAHGADARQPQTLLEVPDATTLDKLLSVWRANKRPAEVLLVFDKSGSMKGNPLVQAKLGAHSFLDALQPRDEVGFMAFDNTIYPIDGPFDLSTGRVKLDARIDALFASGGTALYDATGAGFRALEERAQRDPGHTHTVVVMTDGRDENSTLALEQLVQQLGGEGEHTVRVFTIAYGAQASDAVLGQLAEAGGGASYKGSVANIVSIFQEVASFF